MRKNIELMGVKFLFFLSLFTDVDVQAQKLWSEVKLDRTSAYVGEPVQISITVYTSTWFTSGIDPGNIKVNGAFTVYFRPVSVSVMKNGQTYPGVELIYHVFPFNEKDIVFPSLTLEVESPPEGDFKGVRHKLSTHERTIHVKPIPPDFDKSQWLVAANLSVNDHWVGDLKNVKVGDVLERRITRTAANTVSELIPPVVWDSLANVGMYPARSSVENHKSKTAISATRSETMRYLFEKEGEVVIPDLVFNWYNPYRKQLYKRTLKSITISVKPNPDPGVLASIRESLQADVAKAEATTAEDKPVTILGFSPEVFAVVVVITIVAVYLVFIILRGILRHAKRKREQYLESEEFYFHQFLKTIRRDNTNEIITTAYRWIDRLHLAEPSIYFFIKTYGIKDPGLQSGELEKLIIPITPHEWKAMRKNYIERKTIQVPNGRTYWINPT